MTQKMELTPEKINQNTKEKIIRKIPAKLPEKTADESCGAASTEGKQEKSTGEKLIDWLDAGGQFDSGQDRLETAAKKNVQDSIFTNLFRERKYAFQLYQALHPEDKETTEEQIRIVTLTNVLVNQLYNDLGLLVIGKNLLVLMEEQTKWSWNILVRIPGYWALTVHRYIIATKQDLYGSKKVSVPEPEFYVLHPGKRKNRPKVLRLSRDFFGKRGTAIDVTVKMIYDRKNGDIISQYVRFTQVYREQRRRYGKTRQAVLETIRICCNEGILKEYLENRREEAISAMMTLFDQETAVEAYANSREKRAEKRGETIGEKREKENSRMREEAKSRRQAKYLSELGLSLEKIAQAVEASVDTVKVWLAGNPQSVK